VSDEQHKSTEPWLTAQDTEGTRTDGARIAPPGGGSVDTVDLGELGELPAGFTFTDEQTLIQDLISLSPHNRRYALRKLTPLAEFWREDLKREGRDRCRTRAEVAARHGIGLSTLEYREKVFREKGVRGLMPPGRSQAHPVAELPTEPGKIPVSELLRRMATLMLQAAAELERSSQARQ